MTRTAALLICVLGSGAVPGEPPADFFRSEVQPLLTSKCVSCHGPEVAEEKLRLDSRAATLKGGERGPAIIVGKPAESLLVTAVHHAKKGLAMPPKEKLTAKEIAVLERWIREGAVWPTDVAVTPTAPTATRIGDAWTDPNNPITKLFHGERIDLWSLKPIRPTTPPPVKNTTWVRGPIDQFISARHEAAGVTPNPEADRRMLLRRLTFDLIGLPPTANEVDTFVADPSPDAVERVVDRLLSSPQYGEHWARMWLDVVRYSDSNGFDWDEFRPQAWRFRDYVIRSLNADKPFDQFIREQLAGDELLNGPPRSPAEQDMLIATGYLRLGPQDNSANLFNEQGRARAEILADLTETTASAFLGLTMSCCRCHDHKHDPLSHADHYRLRAFFEATKFGDDIALDLADDLVKIERHNKEIDGQITATEARRQELTNPVRERLLNERAAQLDGADLQLFVLAEAQLTKAERDRRQAVKKALEPAAKEIEAALPARLKQKAAGLAKELKELRGRKKQPTTGLLMTDAPEPPATYILAGGDVKSPKAAVLPGYIGALNPNAADIQRGANPKTTGRRLTLANWIVGPQNPLTARVIVNRIWQGHFGRGLVTTPDDFGHAGAKPTHPELLDWLAADFVGQGWSLKRLHRQIVLSAVYRQSSQVTTPGDDPDNALYTRHPLRRLSAEQLRDALLWTAGSLQAKAGGAPVWPELPPDVLKANPALLDDNPQKTKGWYPSPPTEQKVRSIYLVQKRTVRVPFMETFDQPENAVCCGRRNVSTVAPQALALLNSPLAVEAAKDFAARVAKDDAGVAGTQVKAAFRFALQRLPDAKELAECQRLLERRGLAELCRALLNLNEFAYVD